MSKLNGVWTRLRRTFRRRSFEQQMAAEMREHLERETTRRIANGENPATAHHRAALEFGHVDSYKEQVRDHRFGAWFDGIWRNVRFALRSLRKAPGFTATALGTLTLCIGANLTIFAVIDAILLRPLPFPDSDRLVAVVNAYPGAGEERSSSSASIANYFERRSVIPAFSSVSLIREDGITVGEKGAPNRVPIARVTPEFFATLGVSPAMGRAFTDAELAYGPDEVAVITDPFWRTHFQADPSTVGKTFLTDGQTITVVGILPQGFRFLSSRAQFFRPLSHPAPERESRYRHSNSTFMVARLAPGHTLGAAQAQLDALNAGLLVTDPYPDETKRSGFRTELYPLHADHVREVRPTLVLLQCGVLSLLLIGAVNLANLFLIRASARTKELTVRYALGASKRHIGREVLTETLLIALSGGALGLGLGSLGIKLLAVLGTDRLPLGATVGLDARTAAVSLAVTVLLGVLLALPVIWFNLRPNLAAGLQAESRGGTASHAAQRLRHGFIVAQVALAFVLLSSAGLLGVSLQRVLAAPTGFHPENVLTGQLNLPWKNYQSRTERLAFVERLIPAIRGLPGVTNAAVAGDPPFTEGGTDAAISVAGHTPQAGEAVHSHYVSDATGDYWNTVGIPLVRGRFLEDADNHRDERVCVVDEAFARRYWLNDDPLGQHVNLGYTLDDKNAFTIVGVVGNVKQNELGETPDHGAVYLPYSAFGGSSFSLVVRTSLPPTALVPAIRQAILQLDPEMPIDDVRTMETRIDDSLIARRSPAVLAAIFATLALLLAAIGTYGVLAYSVSQRRREIGVRMALGARPAQIGRQFLALGGRLLVAGMAFGAFGTWAAARTMQTILFDTPALPPSVLATTAAMMALVSLAACLFPARRASKVDPMIAMRAE